MNQRPISALRAGLNLRRNFNIMNAINKDIIITADQNFQGITQKLIDEEIGSTPPLADGAFNVMVAV